MANKTLARLLIILAVAVAVPEMARLEMVNPMQYAAYMVLALLAAAFKVRWQTPQGSIPIYLLFVLIALAGMPVPQVLILGGIAAVVECLVSYRGPSRMERLLFEAAVVIIAIGMADLAIHQTHLGDARLLEAVRMVLTGVTFFVGYSFPRAFVEALDEGRHLGRVWREKYLWMMPHLAAAAVVAGVFEQANRTLGSWQIPVLAVLVSYLVYRSYRLYTARLEDGRNHAEEMADLHMRTIETLALAIDAKDETTADHLSRVQCYAMEIGRELGLAANELEALKAASLLHDIGKLAVPEHIISKPGRLTPEEFEKMKIHPVVGAEILERVRLPYPVVPIVRSHHEKWDGTGYPDRISGEAIPIGARILAAVDCLDALASDRQYRKALPLDEAIGVVVREAGRAFDPRVVEVLARRYRELEEKARSIPAVEPLKLSRGPAMPADVAPAAGFVNEGTSSKGGDFLDKIAAARQEAQALFEMAQTLGSSLSLDETLSVLSVRLRRVVPYDALAVYVARARSDSGVRERGELPVVYFTGDPGGPGSIGLGGGEPAADSERESVGGARLPERPHEIQHPECGAGGSCGGVTGRGGRPDALSIAAGRVHNRPFADPPGAEFEARAGNRERAALPAGRDLGDDGFPDGTAERAFAVPCAGRRAGAVPAGRDPAHGGSLRSGQFQGDQRRIRAFGGESGIEGGRSIPAPAVPRI